MKITVDVLRAEQSWDLETHEQQNYLVIEVLGIETRVPCTEDQLVHALSQAGTAGHPKQEYRPGRDEDDEVPFESPEEDVRVQAPTTFVSAPEVDEFEDEAAAPPPRPPLEKRRKLAPVRRQRGDDAGIAQG